MPDRQNVYLQIGEAAERLGVTQRTLRYYEEKGLLKPPCIRVGGFRMYSEEDVRRVEQIRRLQKLLGLPLTQIHEIIEAAEVENTLPAADRPAVEIEPTRRQILAATEVIERQGAIIRQRLQQLQIMREELTARLRAYRSWLAAIEMCAGPVSVPDQSPESRGGR